jgi:hypothetical protein
MIVLPVKYIPQALKVSDIQVKLMLCADVRRDLINNGDWRR